MNKIPVGQTIEQSYAFVFGRYLSLLGVVWLPMVLTAGLSLLYARWSYGAWTIVPPESMSPQMAIRAVPFSLLLSAVMMAIIIVIGMGVVREAVGTRSGPRFVYFRFGSDELRAAGAAILLVIGLYIVLIVAIIVSGVIGAIVIGVHGATNGAKHDPTLLGIQILGFIGMGALVASVVCIYFGARFGFLLVPATAAEHRFALERSWELTKGNFWRALTVIIATFIPVIAVHLIVIGFTLGPMYVAIFTHLSDQQAMMRQMHAVMQTQSKTLPYIWGLNLLLAPLTYGLWFAPGAFAYRSLTSTAGNDGTTS
jgi:hypothetical protein